MAILDSFLTKITMSNIYVTGFIVSFMDALESDSCLSDDLSQTRLIIYFYYSPQFNADSILSKLFFMKINGSCLFDHVCLQTQLYWQVYQCHDCSFNLSDSLDLGWWLTFNSSAISVTTDQCNRCNDRWCKALNMCMCRPADWPFLSTESSTYYHQKVTLALVLNISHMKIRWSLITNICLGISYLERTANWVANFNFLQDKIYMPVTTNYIVHN